MVLIVVEGSVKKKIKKEKKVKESLCGVIALYVLMMPTIPFRWKRLKHKLYYCFCFWMNLVNVTH